MLGYLADEISLMAVAPKPRAPYFRQHRYMYDFDLLRDLLIDAGFTSVIRRDYRVGVVPDLEILDNRPEETLYVEATR